MKERGVYDEAHSYDYIAQLLQITPTAANVKQYCAIVRDKALLRNLGTAAGEISGLVQEGVGTAQGDPGGVGEEDLRAPQGKFG